MAMKGMLPVAANGMGHSVTQIVAEMEELIDE
jgi:hypothetical protein